MAQFRTTAQIFGDHGEVFESRWMDHNKPIYPPTRLWSNDRELYVEDVDIWEVIVEFTGGGVYASWCPHAELYMVVLPIEQGGVMTWYGPTAEKQVRRYLDQKGIYYSPYPEHYHTGVTVTEHGLVYEYQV